MNTYPPISPGTFVETTQPNTAKEYRLPLDESQVLFFSELIALAYCTTLKNACLTSIELKFSVLPALLEATLRENLRALLREPLRNPLFREEFSEHFSAHDCDEVREVAWAWMQEALIWEN